MVKQSYTQMRIYVEESTSTSLRWINDLVNGTTEFFNNKLLMLKYLEIFDTVSLATWRNLFTVKHFHLNG